MKAKRETRSIATVLLCAIATMIAPLDVPAATKADFNGDGWGDLAVGVPSEDISGQSDAGGIEIIYGSASGLTNQGRQFITQDSPNCPEIAFQDDHFGDSLATGDFNKDGFSDLAVGAPGDDVGGVVHVFYGTAIGLTCLKSVAWRENNFPGAIVLGKELFGSALAVGDFNLDTYSDLVIAAEHDQVGSKQHAGSVRVIYGGNSGLGVAGSKLWTLGQLGLPKPAASFDHFGSSLAAGNFGKGGHTDLAIGIPGKRNETGAVVVLYGSNSGLTADGSQYWSQGLGIAGKAEFHDAFGYQLAAGNFGGTPQDDLAISATGEDQNTGLVHILYGSDIGLTVNGNQSWFGASTGDYYGYALVAADFGHSTHADLAIGAPYAGVSGVGRAGDVQVLYGSPSGLSFANAQLLNIPFGAASLDRFGRALGAANFGKSGKFDLAIGIPGRTVGAFGGGLVNDAGAVSVLYGSPNGLTSPQGWTQSFLSGVPDWAETDDMFGSRLTR